MLIKFLKPREVSLDRLKLIVSNMNLRVIDEVQLKTNTEYPMTCTNELKVIIGVSVYVVKNTSYPEVRDIIKANWSSLEE